jgi:hypothetical protein
MLHLRARWALENGRWGCQGIKPEPNPKINVIHLTGIRPAETGWDDVFQMTSVVASWQGDEEPTLGLPISPFMDCSGHSWPSSRPISQAHSEVPPPSLPQPSGVTQQTVNMFDEPLEIVSSWTMFGRFDVNPFNWTTSSHLGGFYWARPNQRRVVIWCWNRFISEVE